MENQQFIQSGDRKITMAVLEDRAARAATGLATLGVGENDCVAIFLRNDLAFLEATVATGFIGAYAVPVNWHFKDDELRYVLEDSGAKVVLVHADLCHGLGDWLPNGVQALVVATPPELAEAYSIPPEKCRVADGDLDWDSWRDSHAPFAGEALDNRSSMIYTSGTTGLPKGVRRYPSTPEQSQAGAKIAARGFGLEAGAIAAMTGPMYHSAPNGYARVALRLGCSLVLLPRFEPEGLLADIDKHKISHMHMVPTMFVRLLRLSDDVKQKYDLSCLKFIVHGAAPCPIEAKTEMIKWWGPVIYEYYGSTETGLTTMSTPAQYLERPGTVGKAHVGTELRIYDDDGNILPAGEIGEVYMTLNSFSDFTYHNNDEKRAEIGRDNYVTNGDVGYLDEAGFLFLCDRKKDMVISAGVNIYPAEIESILINMPGVYDCAVFGIPDDEFGESLAAAIETISGESLAESDILDYLRQHLAGYKVPKLVEFHASLPREDTGKIFKRKLRDPHWEKAGRQI